MPNELKIVSFQLNTVKFHVIYIFTGLPIHLPSYDTSSFITPPSSFPGSGTPTSILDMLHSNRLNTSLSTAEMDQFHSSRGFQGLPRLQAPLVPTAATANSLFYGNWFGASGKPPHQLIGLQGTFRTMSHCKNTRQIPTARGEWPDPSVFNSSDKLLTIWRAFM